MVSAIRRAPQILATTLAVALAAIGPAMAQQRGRTSPAPGMTNLPTAGMTEDAEQTGGGPAGGNPMMRTMDKTDKAMVAAPVTGDVDQDFVAMMIPHHEGAIDMAKVELAAGKDPFLRALAQRIIAERQRQIRELQAWQAKHPVR